MRYCAFCRRISPGRPAHCQYCGRTFGVRICSHCREINPREALACRRCGSSELSETSGPLPHWLVFLKILRGILIFILMIGLIRNLEFLLNLLIIVGLLCLGFLCAPPIARRILKRIFRYFWIAVSGKRNRK